MTEQAPPPGGPSGWPGGPAASAPGPPFPAAGGPGTRTAPSGPAAPPPPPPREAWQRPTRVEAVPGTPFGMVFLDVPPVTSGLAVGSLVAGIVSVLVAFVVGCFGLLGAGDGWGAWAAGAFAVLAGLAGLAGVVLGELGRRQIRRSAPPPAIRFTGRKIALAGLICGGSGLVLTGLTFFMALVLQLTS